MTGPAPQIVGGLIRLALRHLDIVRCPRCLRGTLTVDLDRVAMSCSNGCGQVAHAVGQAARRLTGELRQEGEALLSFCAAAEKEPAPEELLYDLACRLPTGARELVIDLVVKAARMAA